jgi:hypothetical protein
VLVVTAISQWQMFYFDLGAHLRAWRELERLPEHGVNVVIKPHPRFDDYAFYEGLRPRLADWRQAQPGIAVARDAFLEEVLPACDLVVVPNFPTTAAVEAMLFRKPVLYLQCGFEEATCCTSLAPGCLVVREVDEIRPALLGILGDTAQQERLVQRGQAFLDDFLGPRDGQATRRLADLVAGAVRERTLDPRPAAAGSRGREGRGHLP